MPEQVYTSFRDTVLPPGAHFKLAGLQPPPSPPPAAPAPSDAPYAAIDAAGDPDSDDETQPPIPFHLPHDPHALRKLLRQREGAAKAANRAALYDKTRGNKAWWTDIRETCDPSRSRPLPSAVSLDATLSVMSSRINVAEALPASFDSSRFRAIEAAAALIPNPSTDSTPSSTFSANFTSDDIAAVKSTLENRLHTATGPDRVQYDLLSEVPNDLLAAFFNACIILCDVPSSWLLTEMIALLKPGKDAIDPANYRHVSLESCGLKFLSTLITNRLSTWAETHGLIPPFQNGFRPGARTLDNLFVLRAAVERARSMGRSLFVTFVDLSNAFPSTHRPALWLKLYRLGFSGPIFDWVRMVYSNMEYFARLGDETSDLFSSSRGILQGDPLSPLLFFLFLSDLRLPPDPDDLSLAGDTPAPLLGHADDLAAMSLSTAGMQRRIVSIVLWCALNFLEINPAKTFAMVFGKLPSTLPTLYVGSVAIVWRDLGKYLGALLSSSQRDIFAPHYHSQSDKAAMTSALIGAIRNVMGDISIVDLLLLYKARVDPLLTYGCEIMPDVTPSALSDLHRVQRKFLRARLALPHKSVIAPLHSETGIWPIEFHRFDLLLRYRNYLLTVQPNRLACAAYRDSLDLLRCGSPCWLGDLLNVSRVLCPTLFAPLSSGVALEPLCIRSHLLSAVSQSLTASITQCTKLSLLRSLRFRDRRGLLPPPRVLFDPSLQPYLRIPHAKSRNDLVRLLFSAHTLAVELLRYPSRSRPAFPRSARLCRLCGAGIEDEVHVLLTCRGDSIILSLRTVFIRKVITEVPSLRPTRNSTPALFLLDVLSWTSLHRLFAMFVHRVFRRLSLFAMLRPH